MGFKKALADGKFAERLVQSIFGRANVELKESPPKHEGWDLEGKCGDIELLIEVKFDKLAKQTGNLAIEYGNSKKACNSGILATKSNFWCIVLWDSVWLARTRDLLKYFNETPGRDVHGGDDNSYLRLYLKDQLLTIFTRIDQLSGPELSRYIIDSET